jgi:hypothetical protein
VVPGTTPKQMHAGNGPRSKGVICEIKMWVERTVSLFTLVERLPKIYVRCNGTYRFVARSYGRIATPKHI